MTQPGWYPDQNGGPGMKYWDGQAWHDLPAAPAPPAMPTFPSVPVPPAAPVARSSRKWIWWILAPIALLIAVPMMIPILGAVVSKTTGSGSTPAAEKTGERRDTTFNFPLTITSQQVRMDGTFANARQFVQVSAPASVPAQDLLPPQGAFYGSQVTIAAESGTVSVNPFSFSARTANGTNLQPTIAMGLNDLPATELPQGQKVSGWLVFDVPNGQGITEIILSDPLGTQLGRWTAS
jgi:hypothetical protein